MSNTALPPDRERLADTRRRLGAHLDEAAGLSSPRRLVAAGVDAVKTAAGSARQRRHGSRVDADDEQCTPAGSPGPAGRRGRLLRARSPCSPLHADARPATTRRRRRFASSWLSVAGVGRDDRDGAAEAIERPGAVTVEQSTTTRAATSRHISCNQGAHVSLTKFYTLIDEIEIAMMVTRRADGHLRSRAMATQKVAPLVPTSGSSPARAVAS